MLLRRTTERFRAKFLLTFTKELIDQSATEETYAIYKILKRRIQDNIDKENREKSITNMLQDKKIFPPLPKPVRLTSSHTSESLLKRLAFPFQRLMAQNQRPNPQQNVVPEIKTPETIQDVQPQFSIESIDLGKLNPLLKDPTVTAIECNGPHKNIFVQRTEQRLPTKIKLRKDEIEEIMNKFSKLAKIPITSGVNKIAHGNLVLNAYKSNVVDPKFVITKIPPTPQNIPQNQ